MVEVKVEVKSLAETIKCQRKIIEHVRKKTQENMSDHRSPMSQEYQNKLSDHEKCFRSSLVKVALFTFCSMGLGKSICASYDRLKEEEKKLGRKLTDDEIHQIVINIAREHNIVSEL